MGVRKTTLRILGFALTGMLACVLSLGAAFFSSARWAMVLGNTASLNEDAAARTIQWDGAAYEYNPNVATVLFLGVDKENGRLATGYNGQCDALMLFALNTDTRQATCIPLSRNLKTQIEAFAPFARESEGLHEDYLCLAYSYGASDAQSGMLSCEAVSRLLGIPVHEYLTLNMSGVAALADAVEGVELTVLEDVHRTDMHEGDTVLLQGQSALDYVWQRDTADDYSASGRAARQAQFAQAFAKKAAALAQEDMRAVGRLLETVQAHTNTNLHANELAYLAVSLLDGSLAELDMKPLPGQLVPRPGKMSEFVVDEEAMQALMLEVFYQKVS